MTNCSVTSQSSAAAVADNTNITEILMELTPQVPQQIAPLPPTNIKVFPDSGASLCLAGTKHLLPLGLHPNDLTKCCKLVTTVGGHKLQCFGSVYVIFRINKRYTRQKLYFCRNINRIYLSRTGCNELNILPLSFPYPMDSLTHNGTTDYKSTTNSRNNHIDKYTTHTNKSNTIFATGTQKAINNADAESIREPPPPQPSSIPSHLQKKMLTS